MNERRTMERRIADYIAQVEGTLGHLSTEDRDSIADDVDEHVRTALDESQWSLDELDRVLERLGPAAAYVADAERGGAETEGHPEPAGQEATEPSSPAASAAATGSPRFYRMAAVALAFSVAGYLAKPLLDLTIFHGGAYPVHFGTIDGYPGSSLGLRLASLLSVILGLGLFLGPLLGLVALGRILASSGKLSGLACSVVSVVAGPLTYLLIWTLRSSPGSPSASIASFAVLFALFAIVSVAGLGVFLFLRLRRPTVR